MGGDLNPTVGNGTRTLVLMGKTGNGKSATGNSILCKKAFTSKRSLSGVTSSSERHTATLPNGGRLAVIDTPGLFDFSVRNETISKEIVKCIELARDGVDAVLLVFSFGARFTEEEAAAFESLRTFFGPKIIGYIILVFTGGDNLEEDDSLSDYLDGGSDRLKEILALCDHRIVLFDNKTNDPGKKECQLQELFSLVDAVIQKNDGQRYSDDLFKEIREAAMKKVEAEKEAKASKRSTEELVEVMKKIQISLEEDIKKLHEKVEHTLKETQELQMKLDEERAARSRAEENAEDARKRSEEEIRKLKAELANRSSGCAIM